MTQTQLNFADEETRKKAGGQLARRMIAYLNASPGWTTRAEFKTSIGLSDRECRLGVSAAHMRIIFGQRGYKLTNQSTLDEIDTCGATILSQIQALQKKYSQLMLRRHKTDRTIAA